MKQIFLFIIFIFCIWTTHGQEGGTASQKLENAISLMDNGFPDEAIQLLAEAKALDKKNYVYDFETGYAYYIKKDFKKALEYFNETLKFRDNSDQCYQMTGNFYDLNGDPDQAIRIYDKGLVKFPNSGRLYMEKGNVFWGKKKYLEALPFYEKGIQVDPTFPSNYYRASLIYCNSMDPMWGLLYGEVFMNLEQDTKRTEEISKLLFLTYRDHITFSGDTLRLSFCNHDKIFIHRSNDIGSMTLPFGSGVYEPILRMSIDKIRTIDLNTLDTIRTYFIGNYYAQNFSKVYSNSLFEYQQKIIAQGYGSAYNYWILKQGDWDAFLKWKESHLEEWNNFLKWMAENPVLLDARHPVYRQRYE